MNRRQLDIQILRNLLVCARRMVVRYSKEVGRELEMEEVWAIDNWSVFRSKNLYRLIRIEDLPYGRIAEYQQRIVKEMNAELGIALDQALDFCAGSDNYPLDEGLVRVIS